MLNKFILFILIIFPFTISCSPKDDNSYIVYGQKSFFSINTPQNWFFNSKLSQEYQLPYCIQPEEKRGEIQTVLYSGSFERVDNSKETILDIISWDQRRFKKNNPGLRINKINIKFSNIIKTNYLTGKYYIYEYIGFKEKYKEIMIYIDAIDVVCIVVLSAKTKNDFKKYYPVFVDVVKSFKFLGKNVEIYKK